MKSIKYLIIGLFTICQAGNVLACWGPWYTPNGYYMYRVYNKQPEISSGTDSTNPDASRNCREWQRLTSDTIPLEDIYDIVYTIPLEEFEKIYDNRDADYSNKFIEWITEKDSAILDFLLLAKTNEYIRFQRNSRWYYPSMRVGARMTIEEIAEKALSVNEPKLRDRYLLQAIRALFTLGRYEECVELWNAEVVNLPADNLMRKLIQPYIAGTEFRLNHSDKAITYFAEMGDIESMLFCAGRTGEQISTVEALEMVCEYAPNSTYIEKTLQSFIRDIEPLGEYYWEDEYYFSIEIQRLYSLCLRMAKGGKSDNPAMWYYTAAFLSDFKGDIDEASRLIGLAEKCKKSDFMEESIKIFRIYIDAKTLPYNTSYERKLLTQLQWLDTMIINNIDEKVRQETASGYKLDNCESYYYWNDMLRRIVLAEICPRMLKAGKHTRALQLANMADNRLLGLVNKREVTDWNWTDDGDYYETTGIYTMSGYRYSQSFNSHDYSDHFFEMVDSLGADTAIDYLRSVERPASDLDRYLNERGYTERDYLNDIAGTQCLRSMRYEEAVKYLGAVSEAYKDHLNVRMEYDPFSIEPRAIEPHGDFRYDFACRMHALEQNISLTTEPNRKARLIMEYTTGLCNSFNNCWELTQYYRGCSYWGQVCEKRQWEVDDFTRAAVARSEEYFNLACEIATDDEVAAELNYALCNYKTVAEKYPNTTKGELVRGQCDNLCDYNAMPINPKTYSWQLGGY
ncbi:MAG: hypothetical protein J6Q21_03045 [Alistipes sp.]|nr:hypothetical protein [Alistipes sp.]